MKIIAHIRTDFKEKFGIPRQSGIVKGLKGRIVFAPEYRNDDGIRGLEGFSHIWLIWMFSQSVTEKFRPTVRPPRLGGNTKMGVFATRSPFRPNPIGLSCVRIERIVRNTSEGTVIEVSGCDMSDNTPIYDIKPYLPFTDSIPDASYGFAEDTENKKLDVDFPEGIKNTLPCEVADNIAKILSDDPRPSYQHDENRIYGFTYAGYEIKFTANTKTLYIKDIKKAEE